MKYFSVNELTASDTATAKGIDNTPSSAIRAHIVDFIENGLDPLREAWGSGIKVNSGYRCTALNTAVGGAATSAHRCGYAADLYPTNGDFDAFKAFVVAFMADKKFDECIIEKNSKGAQWIHYAMYSIAGLQRQKLLSLNVE